MSFRPTSYICVQIIREFFNSLLVDLDFLGLKKEIRSKVIESLRQAVALEQANITMRRLGVHVASWFTDIKPNDPASLEKHASSVFWDGSDDKLSSRQIASLKDIVITLALNLQAQAQDDSNEKLACLAPVFRLYKKTEIPTWILPRLPKLITDNLQG